MLNRMGIQRFRSLAGVVTILFVLLAVVAPAFHIHNALLLAHSSSASSHCHVSPSVTDTTATVLFATAVSTTDECTLCQWLTSASYNSTTTSLVLVLLTTGVLLLLAVRLAALCSRPAPRRGFRGPPAFAAA
jgi:hypothetical protein